MKVVVIGTGHVGLITAVTMAHLGHEVTGLDDDPAKVETLSAGRPHFFEPGLPGILKEQIAAGRLSFTGDYTEAMKGAELAFICVGTPPRASGEANMVAVENAAWSAALSATGPIVLAQKATVPVKTAERIKKLLSAGAVAHKIHLVSNPEFLREGTAIDDSLKPDRIVVGAEDEFAHQVMRRIYRPMIDAGSRYFATDIKTAELSKHACNSFLAAKISFANALARICEASGADVVAVADIMGSDERIGREFLNAGLGYGGYCLPKDVAAFKSTAERLGYDFALLGEVMKINAQALNSAFEKINESLWNLEEKKILLLGLAFKRDTDDVRESPGLALAERLIQAGARVTGYDPHANASARSALPGLEVTEDLYEAAVGADCIVIASDAPQFAELDLVRLKGSLTRPIIIDTRNLLQPQAAQEAGFTYLPTGRPPVNL